MIDIGLNLSSSQFRSDLPEVVTRAIERGVDGFLLTTVDQKSFEINCNLVDRYSETMRATLGVHPHNAKHWPAFKEAVDIDAMLQDWRILSIGECGLDYSRMNSTRDEQIVALREQLEIAGEYNLPVFLHLRPYEKDPHGHGEYYLMKDFVDILEAVNLTAPHKIHGVVHCFTGSTSMLERIVSLGFYVGITGWVTDTRRGVPLRQAIPFIPDDRLLIETDAPYLKPWNAVSHRNNRRNEPSFLIYVLQELALLRGTSVDELKVLTNTNFRTLFKWYPGS